MVGEPESISEVEFLEQLRYLSALQASKKAGSKKVLSSLRIVRKDRGGR